MPSRLDALRARLAAATPGPWKVCHDDDGIPLVCCGQDGVHAGPVADSACIVRRGEFAVECPLGDADAALIAHAPADLTALLAVVEAAQDYRRNSIALIGQDALGTALDTALAALTTEEE